MEVINRKEYTDTEVINKILNGESELYEILIRRYNPFLYRIGRSYGYCHQDTEDLMQESFVNAYFALSKFENRSAFKTWLTRIMLNNCHTKKQKSSFKNEIAFANAENSDLMFHQHIQTDKTVINKELGHVIENALLGINDEYRIVFTLRELNGLSVAETANVLNITEGNVKVRLNRAKSMLRSEIEKIYSPEDIFEFNLVYCNRIVEKVMKEISRES
ncbi:MAG: sigma-70 family polymerase sigma factor [Bacteroidota bacterium]|nr:sigma-70 family polymerase sigma factor [Bacteroidota bacterium]